MYFYISLIFSLAIDILTKYIANVNLSGEISLIGEYFSLRLIQNTGIAFSLPITGMLLKVITIAILICIFYYYLKYEKSKKDNIINIAYGLILGGAIGNAIERILYSEVTDFLRIKYFAIFNFGDIFINIGVLLLLYLYLCKKGTNKI